MIACFVYKQILAKMNFSYVLLTPQKNENASLKVSLCRALVRFQTIPSEEVLQLNRYIV